MAIRGTGFVAELLDEFIAKYVMDFINRLRGKKPPSDQTGGAEQAKNLSEDPTREAVFAFWGAPKMKTASREMYHHVKRQLNKETQDKVECALGDALQQLKNGIWPPIMEKITVPGKAQQPKKGQQPTQQGQPTVIERPLYKKGWDPPDVFVRAFNRAGESEESMKFFFEDLLQETLWERVSGHLASLDPGGVVSVTGRALRAIAYAYLALLAGSGIAMWLTLSNFAEDPTRYTSFIWGFIWFLIFTGLLWIIAKPLLPKEL